MKVEYVNPFIESVYELLSTMFGCAATRGEIGFMKAGTEQTEITALIGWSGPARGMVALALPRQTALNMAGRLLMVDMTEMNDDVLDAVSEVVNIIAGNAKARFSQSHNIGTMDLSLPTVIVGARYDVQYPSQTAWVEVPFTSELGSFTLRITFEMVEGEK